MRVVYGNIKSNPQMRQSYVENDIAHLEGMSDTEPAVCMGSEIAPSRYKAAWTRIMRVGGLTTYCSESESPVSVAEGGFEVLGSEVRITHAGRKLVTPTRKISVVKTRRTKAGRPNPHGNLIAFMATHFISGGWSNRHPLTKKWRQARWFVHYQVMKSWIAELHAQGYTVVFAGDFNRADVPAFFPGQVLLAEHRIDHMWVIPAEGKRIVLRGGPEITLAHQVHTDHPMLAASFVVQPA